MTALHDSGTDLGPRQPWVDNLRVLVIAGVVVVHTATGYVVDVADWYYDDERATSEPWSTLVTIPVLFAAVFALGPLFVVAGWFSARSIAHRGPGGFARSRLVRLGVPLVVFVIVVQPLTDYLGNIHDEGESLAHYLGATEVSVMWFAAALLAFSLAHAAWELVRPRPPTPRPLRPRVLVAAALSIALTSYAVWLAWPLQHDGFLNLRVSAWPQGAVLYALGVHAAHGDWLTDLPRRVQRVSGWVVLGATSALGALVAVVIAPEGDEPATRADLPTLVFALLDGVIAVAFALWLLGWLQHRWSTHGPLVGRAARASFATYVIHPLAVTVIMLVFAPVPLAPALKFLVVSAAAVPASFATGYTLTRLPGVSTVL